MSDLDVILHHLSHMDAFADGYVRCSVRRVGGLIRGLILECNEDVCREEGCSTGVASLSVFRDALGNVRICVLVDVGVAVTSRVVGFGYLGIRW